MGAGGVLPLPHSEPEFPHCKGQTFLTWKMGCVCVCVCAHACTEGSAADSNSVATSPHPGRLRASLLEPIVLDKYLSSGHPPSRPLSQTPEQKLWFKKGSRLPAERGASLPLLQVRSLRSGKAPAGRAPTARSLPSLRPPK